MAAIYRLTGGTITQGLTGSSRCDQAVNMAREMARERRETVILSDDDGEWLVGPRGGIRRFTDRLKKHYGFNVEGGEKEL